jgi:methionyl-tRNA formyltransferase
MAGDLMVRALDHWREHPVREKHQNDREATYASKIDRSASRIRWDREAVTVSAHIRALDPRPGAYTTLGGREIKLYSSRVPEEDGLGLTPGRVVNVDGGGLHVETGKGLVEIREVQYPGKKRMPASDFLRGFSLPEGTLLGE